ncbi:MAG: FAD-binding oxidoreductase, partial [bacterium]
GYALMLDKPPATIDPALLARFSAIVGEKYAITDPQAQAPYLVEMRNMFQGHTPMVLRPDSVAQVSDILKLANETRTPLVPQGGNTGLVGGQVPCGPGNQIVLSLGRMTALREIGLSSNTMTVEAGMILSRVQEEAAHRSTRTLEGASRLRPNTVVVFAHGCIPRRHIQEGAGSGGIRPGRVDWRAHRQPRLGSRGRC